MSFRGKMSFGVTVSSARANSGFLFQVMLRSFLVETEVSFLDYIKGG